MARLGVSNLISWHNARINNPSKLNLIKSSYRYNQNTWYAKRGIKNKDPEKVKVMASGQQYEALNYMWISSWGIMTHRYSMDFDGHIHKFKLSEGEYVIGSHFVDFKYPDKFHVFILIRNGWADVCMGNSSRAYPNSFFDLKNTSDTLARARVFVREKESEFRELKRQSSKYGSSL